MVLDTFIDSIMGEFERMPFQMARDVVPSVMDRFFRETRAWKGLGDRAQYLTLFDGIREYDIEGITGARLISVDEVWFNGYQLTPADDSMLETYLGSSWGAAEGSAPLFYRMLERRILEIYPMPRNPEPGFMKLVGVFTLAPGATTVPDEIMNEYGHTMMDGIKGELFMKKGDWQDLRLAQIYQMRFKNEITNIRIRLDSGNVGASGRVRPIAFGG